MKQVNLIKSLLNILSSSKDNSKKLNAIMNLLIKLNENILKNFEEHYTTSLTQEKPLEFMNMFSYDVNYPIDDKATSQEEMAEILKGVLETLFSSLKINQFNFLDDFGNYSNSEFMSTYQQMQKVMGSKKLVQAELFRSILDIFVNSYANGYFKTEIEELAKIVSEKKIFNIIHQLFLDFPFCNIYQLFYNQIIDIVLTNVTPSCIVESVFKDVKDGKNLIAVYLEKISDNLNLKFTFKTKNQSYSPCISFIMTLLNKIYTCQNEDVKKYIDEKFDVFNEVIGKEINRIYEQKLLLADNEGTRFGGADDDKPLEHFGKSNFMQLLDEDIIIYNAFLKGEDYKKLFNEKLEREKLEKEKEKEEEKENEQEIVDDNEENKDEQLNDNDDEGGADNDKGGLKESKKEDNDEDDEEKEDKNRESGDVYNELYKEPSGEDNPINEESNEVKQYNDANYWANNPNPNEEIMIAIMKDLDA